MSPVVFSVVLALIAAQKLHELVVSRRHLAAARARHGGVLPNAATGSLAWGAMIALHAALIVAPAVEVWVSRPRVPVLAVVAGALGLAAGQIVRAWTKRALGRAWNARAVVDPAVPIVVHGPYRFVRHPNYLAVSLEFLSIPLLGGAWIAWVVLNVLNAAILAQRIRGEERLLSASPVWRESVAPRGAVLPKLADLRGRRSRALSPADVEER